MQQYINITANAFMELVRQPVYLLLMTASACFGVFLSVVPYFGFGDDPAMVKTSVLAVMLLAGLFGAVTNASASVAQEIRSGTALAVLAKPIGRAQFLLAKFTGLSGALALLTYINLIAALLASRMAYDAYGEIDGKAALTFFGAVALAYLVSGFLNYFLQRPFVATAVFAVVILITVAFLLIAFVIPVPNRMFDKDVGIDWNLLPAGILVLFGLMLLAGLALACSTRFDMVPTLAICTSLFVLGLMSDYLFGRRVESGDWWAWIPYTLLPNMQLMWPGDALQMGRGGDLWDYVLKSCGYVAGYVGATLSLALLLFEDRELS